MVEKHSLPLFMGDKIVGKADLNLETGAMTAQIDMELVAILNDALGENLLSISFYGRPATPDTVMESHQKIRHYLEI